MTIKVRTGGAWVQVSDGSAGTGTVTDVTVDYTGRSAPCETPITVTGTTSKQINIPSNSNAFGAKYVQSTEPTGNNVCSGDIWYDTTPLPSNADTKPFIVETKTLSLIHISEPTRPY